MPSQSVNHVRCGSDKRVLLSRAFAFVMTCLVLIAGPANWQLSRVAAADPALSTPANAGENKPAPPKNRPQVKAYIALAALAGILIVGVALVALILLWGARLRRQLRRPLPECEIPERNFWFLKPPKPKASDAMLSDTHIPPHDIPPSE